MFGGPSVTFVKNVAPVHRDDPSWNRSRARTCIPASGPYPVRDFPMPYCYYTCSLLRWTSWPAAATRRAGSVTTSETRMRAGSARALSIHPMTCPYVTKLVAAADELFAGAQAAPRQAMSPKADCLVVPGGCDAARRMGTCSPPPTPTGCSCCPCPELRDPGW